MSEEYELVYSLPRREQKLDPADALWGCRAIAEFIGKSERATYHMLERGLLPARRLGGQWVARRSRLLEIFGEDA